jgi:hypothetical protein
MRREAGAHKAFKIQEMKFIMQLGCRTEILSLGSHRRAIPGKDIFMKREELGRFFFYGYWKQ